MTIAVCYLSPEGVVVGADSTSSVMVPEGGFHYFNHNQKLFELGENSTLAALTWGLGSLGGVSHRSLLAELADELDGQLPPPALPDVAQKWIDKFWPMYTAFGQNEIQLCRALHAKFPFDPNAQPNVMARTRDEEAEYRQLRFGLVVGFCIAGYVRPHRSPGAFEIVFDPLKDKPSAIALAPGSVRCWGTPKIFDRLINGADADLKQALLRSGKWSGTASELDALVAEHSLAHPVLPVRDAIDFVHACIASTIKALKFSRYSQTCGGPIEIAVITTDRPFRWVRHKDWDAAITEGSGL